jgi:hypothetical protein
MRIVFATLLGFMLTSTQAQTVWENHRAPINGYLYRMAQKGYIELNDIILPISRNRILDHLDSLHSRPLSAIEQKELEFYRKEYNIPASPTGSQPASRESSFLKRDPRGRYRALAIQKDNFSLFADPIIGASIASGSDRSYYEVSNGFQFWGNAGKFGFQAHYRDHTLTGDGLDKLNEENPQTTIIELFNLGSNKKNFNEIKGHVSYSWKNGNISLGKDHLLWGYGETGRITLSDRSPSFPYLRLDYRPLKWLHFNYGHAWLNSNIIDSVNSYSTGTTGVSGDIRIRYIPKFLVTHSITVTPIKGLSIAVGESMVYSDQLDVGFMIPVLFFKAYDNNRSNYLINAGSNGQIFAQLSSRNHLRNTHLYATWFIDEITVSEMFNPAKARNQFGYTLGANVTDLGLPYFTLGAEYTRVNPFAYRNLLPAQEYLHYQQELGDWMGNNFDRISLLAKYTPIPKLRLDLRMMKARKGGPGTLVQQYQAVPQPPFLFNHERDRQDIFFIAQYEWINNFYIQLQYHHKKEKPVNAVERSNRLLTLGFSWGL